MLVTGKLLFQRILYKHTIFWVIVLKASISLLKPGGYLK